MINDGSGVCFFVTVFLRQFKRTARTGIGLRSCLKINHPFTGLFFTLLPPENAYTRYARIFSRWMAKNISRKFGWFISRQFLKPVRSATG
jgi:formylmethanofuran dehydrogenase subunit A